MHSWVILVLWVHWNFAVTDLISVSEDSVKMAYLVIPYSCSKTSESAFWELELNLFVSENGLIVLNGLLYRIPYVKPHTWDGGALLEIFKLEFGLLHKFRVDNNLIVLRFDSLVISPLACRNQLLIEHDKHTMVHPDLISRKWDELVVCGCALEEL